MFGLRHRDTHDAATSHAPTTDLVELVDALDVVAETTRAWADGNLEPRLVAAGPTAPIATDLNCLVDRIDAFVRETQASLEAAAQGRYSRQFLVQGMPGRFGSGARSVNSARSAMLATATQMRDDLDTQSRMTQQAQVVSDEVMTAASALDRTAAEPGGVVAQAVSRADAALRTMRDLETVTAQIGDAVRVIGTVAGQTRLLALNATIEAARAGDAGRGFGVVAGEVKSLADESSASTDTIEAQVESVERVARDVARAITDISDSVASIDAHLDDITRAIGEDGGLSGVARRLQDELHRADARTS